MSTDRSLPRALALGALLSLLALGTGCPATTTITGDSSFGGIQSALLMALVQEDYTSHQFVFSTVADFCTLTQNAIDSDHAALQIYEDDLEDLEDLDSTSGRRDWCEAQKAYSSERARINSELVASSSSTGILTVRRVEAEGDERDEPRSGTYRRGWDLDDDEDRFSASFQTWASDPYGAYIDAEINCDLYASADEDSNPSSLPFAPTTDEIYESVDLRSVTEGRVELGDLGNGAWDLALTEGMLRDDSNRDAGTFELAGTFTQCEIMVPDDWSGFDGF